MKTRAARASLLASALVASALLAPAVTEACTRIVYQGAASHLVGRTMDWVEETGTDLWAFPAGLARDGGIGPGSLKWTAR